MSEQTSAPPARVAGRRRWLRRLGWVLLGLVALDIVVCVGVGSTDETWRAPLQYPNKAAGRHDDPEAFSSAAVCGGCHVQHYAEWRESGMGRSSALSMFLLSLYEASLDLKGAPVEDIEQCLHCHAPVAVMGPEPDLAMARAVSQEGVNCDVCHTAAEAHANDAPGMIRWDPKGPKRATLPGRADAPVDGVPPAISPHHDTQYSALHGTSELCGACHMSLWPSNALPIDWTYAEWQRSPWAEEGKTCQSCHMPTYEGIAAPGAPTRTLHRHTFPGGGDVEFVRGTAEVELSLTGHYAGTEVSATVVNTRAGHAFPTGNATAPVVKLVVRAFDEADTEVWSSVRRFKLTYEDAEGNVTRDPTAAVAVQSDTTLQPREPRHEHFFIPQRLGATRVEAELVYRRWGDDIVNAHGSVLWEFVTRYLRQGMRLHRLVFRLGDLDYDNLQRVRQMEPTVVDTAQAVVPPPPEVPEFVRAAAG